MKQENINNLTALWETAVSFSGTFFKMGKINYAVMKNSDWPNRLWFNQDVDIETLQNAKEIILSLNVPLIIPYWDIYNSNSAKLFDDHGFMKKFEQVAMVRKNNHIDFENRLKIIKISNIKEAKIWEEIYPYAFKYKIAKEIILNTQNEVQFYLAKLNNEPIGTGILFTENKISGIHGVGVVPSARRKGFAEEIMKYLINESINIGSTYTVLQSSNMGKGIYLRLGYEEQFVIKNYIL